MFETIAEIKGAIDRFRNDTVYQKLRTRWEGDFDLYRLKPYNAGEGYYSYTSNSPRVLSDKIISLLSGSKLIIRIPLDVLTDDERRVSSNIERFLYGVWNLNDERISLVPDMPSIRDQLSWYATIRGGFCIRVYVHKDDDGQTVPNIAIWDIYNVAYGKGKKGLTWAAHTRRATKEQVKDEFGVDVSEDEVDVIDYWDTKRFGIIVQNKWAIRLEPHGLDYTPVALIQVGAMPPIWEKTYTYTGVYRGESVFASNRNLYPILNKTTSDHLTMVRRGVKVPMGYWSAGGTKTLEEDIFQVEKAAVVPLDINEKLEPIIPPSMPTDTAPLVNLLNGEIQRGGLSHTTYGELGFRLSGFAINQLQQAIETVLQPALVALTIAYTIGSKWTLQQFVDGKFAPISVRGRTSRNEVFGMPEAEEIKHSDLVGNWRPEIRLEPALPKDEAQNFIMANMARQGEVPLLSMRTIRDELLDVADTDLEDQKINQEWASQLPIPRLYDAYLSALYDRRPDVAENILAELKRLLGQLGIVPGGAQGGKAPPPSGLEQEAGGMPGTGMPAGQTGVPSSVLPSEALGGLPPGAMNARPPIEGSL